MHENEENRIFVDSDWKEQAQKEKEQLTSGEGVEEDRPMTFLDILEPLIMETAMALGGAITEDGQVIDPDLDVAEHHLDILSILHKKTKGNLTKEEKEIFDTALANLSEEFSNSYFSDEIE